MQQRKPPAKRLYRPGLGGVGIIDATVDEKNPPVAPAAVEPAPIETIEENVREQLDITKPENRKNIPDSFRQMLNLEPQDIINFFDAKVGECQEYAQVDFLVPKEMTQRRIERLKKIVTRSKEIIEGLSVRVMKIRRGKDEIVDQPTREKFKREENARIARCNVKLSRFRNALRQSRYTEKVWRDVTMPVYFRDVVDDAMRFETVVDRKYIDDRPVKTGGLYTHTTTVLVDEISVRYCDLERYTTILKLDDAALSALGENEAERKATWQIVKLWENAVIRAAVCHSIITPRRDLAELLGLGAILDTDEIEVEETDTTEDKLAIKTGGACYGGRIKSGGIHFRNGQIRQRALESFDKGSPLKEDDRTGYDDSHNDPTSDNFESPVL